MVTEISPFKGGKKKHQGNESMLHHTNNIKKVPVLKEAVRTTTVMETKKPREEHGIDMGQKGVLAVSLPIKKVNSIPTSSELRKEFGSLHSITMFNVRSLQKYTKNFCQENLIGAGTLGSVYYADCPGGQVLAVKKLDRSSPMLQTDESFLELVSSISKLQHANVVKLVGYCVEHGQRLLVYEYFHNGSLNDILHYEYQTNRRISWNARIQIALGAAKALEYLHETCDPAIVHRNFKSANILIDHELNVHVSGCGLSQLISSGSVRQLSENLLSSLGYGAPEFIHSGIYTQQTDIYCFGVVSLELLSGRKSYDKSRPREEQHLVRWAFKQLHDIASLSNLVDPLLDGSYSEKSLSQFADIVSLCIQPEPEFRPPMSEIVRKIQLMMPKEGSW